MARECTLNLNQRNTCFSGYLLLKVWLPRMIAVGDFLSSSFRFKRDYCVKSVRIRSYSGSYFPAFELNRERYSVPISIQSVSLRIQSKYMKMQTRITPNMDTFYAVGIITFLGKANILTWKLIVISSQKFSWKLSFSITYFMQNI